MRLMLDTRCRLSSLYRVIFVDFWYAKKGYDRIRDKVLAAIRANMVIDVGRGTI
jgi:hypothetical protein